MNLFWLIAAAMAAFIAQILVAGEVRIRGRLLADRRTEQKYFWLCVACAVVGLIILIAEAISPPY